MPLPALSLLTFAAVSFSWVLFRAETLPQVGSYIGTMFGGGVHGDTTALLFVTQKAVFYAAAIVFSAPVVPYLRGKLDKLRTQPQTAILPMLCDAAYPAVMVLLFLGCTAYLLKSNYNPFIYFNF